MKYCNHRNNFCLNKKLQKKYLQKQIRKKKSSLKTKETLPVGTAADFFPWGHNYCNLMLYLTIRKFFKIFGGQLPLLCLRAYCVHKISVHQKVPIGDICNRKCTGLLWGWNVHKSVNRMLIVFYWFKAE